MDYEEAPEHFIVAEAHNVGDTSLSTSVNVHIKLSDVNDEAPTILIYTIETDNQPRVTEHAEVGSFVAQIVVTDKDATSPNNDTYCTINSTMFTLVPLLGMEYSINVLQDIDREVEGPQTTIQLSCTDLGLPAMVTEVPIQVIQFRSNLHTGSIKKNRYTALLWL